MTKEKPIIQYLLRGDLDVERIGIEVSGADAQQRAAIMALIVDAVEKVKKNNTQRRRRIQK